MNLCIKQSQKAEFEIYRESPIYLNHSAMNDLPVALSVYEHGGAGTTLCFW